MYALERCRICTAGEYSNPRSGFCLSCPAGTYSDVEGSSQCTTCPANTATAVEGSIACTPCGHPAFSTVYCDNPMSLSSRPTVRPTFPPESMPTFYMGCNTPGYGMQNNANNVAECLPCPVGSANEPNHPGRYCLPCFAGTIAAQIGTVVCTQCPTDSISVPAVQGTYCQPCGHVPYSNTQCEPPIGSPTIMPSWRETPCRIQGYGLQYLNGVSVCVPCPVGFANDNNMEGRMCHRCLSNTIAPVEGTVFCIPCPVGTTSDYAGTYCTTTTPTTPPTPPPTTKPTTPPVKPPTPKPTRRSKAPVRKPTYRPSKARPTRQPTRQRPIRPNPIYWPSDVAYYK